LGGLLLTEGILWVAVVVSLWVWNGSGLAINEHESLVEVWAVLESSDVGSNVLGLNEGLGTLLSVSVLGVAVVSLVWIWDTSSLSVDKGEPLIEVWAVLEASDVGSNILLLSESIVGIAVISNLWVWYTLGLSISQGHSLVEVWAVLKGAKWCSMGLSFSLGEGVVGIAVIADFWVWYTFGLSIIQGHPLIEVWAMWKGFHWCSMGFSLSQLEVFVAVEINLWIWNGFSSTIGKGHSLIEIRALFKSVNTRSPVWIILSSLGKLLHSITSIAVVTNVWVWHATGLTIS
jgi:hypothetical protein